MQVLCTSFKAIATATQVRSKIEMFIKGLEGSEPVAGPLGPRIEKAFDNGSIDKDTKERLEAVLVKCE